MMVLWWRVLAVNETIHSLPAAREKAHKGAFNSRATGLGLEPRLHGPKP